MSEGMWLKVFSLSKRERALRLASRCGWLKRELSFSRNCHDIHASILQLGPTLSVKYRLVAVLKEAISVDHIFDRTL